MTPEEQHLAEQQAILDELAETLTSREQAFAEAGARFARFREMYLRRFAPLYAELDGLEAQIARRLAADSPELEHAASEAEDEGDTLERSRARSGRRTTDDRRSRVDACAPGEL